MIKQVLKFGVVAGASLALLGGVASAAPSITGTGIGSVNKIKDKNVKVCKVKNKNNVAVLNVAAQKSKTGKVKVAGNTNAVAGDATSGDAANSNELTKDVDVTNNLPLTGACCGCEVDEVTPAAVVASDATISNTGALSKNTISSVNVSKSHISNTNNVLVGNLVLQSASSGNAGVWGNTNGGSATSGSAMNTNTANITVSVSNN